MARYLIMIALFLTTMSTNAALKVLHVGDYKTVVDKLVPDEFSLSENEIIKISKQENNLKPFSLFPILSDIPNKQSEAITLRKKPNQPIFLVGDDALSISWLERRYPELKRLGAHGFIVACESEEGLLRIKAAARDLKMTLGNSGDLTDFFGFTFYPGFSKGGQYGQ